MSTFIKGIGNRVKGFAVGSSEVNKLYLGSTLIYDRNALPYDAEIEYLESSGTQYINTEIIPTSATTFIFDMAITNSGDVQNGVVQTISSTYYRFHIGKYNGYFQGGVGTYYIDCFNEDTQRHTFSLIGSGVFKIDNSSYTCNNLSNITIPIFVFARNTNGLPNCYIEGRLYSCQIYDSSELIMNLIPVRVGNVGYMYDTVTKRLFGNAGTGNFVLGQDIN